MQAASANLPDPSLGDESCMLQSVWEDKLKCGFTIDCPQTYTIKEVQALAEARDEAEGQERLQKAKSEAQSACTKADPDSTSSTGGWCYYTANQKLISKDEYAIDQDFFVPFGHDAFDQGLAKAISKLLLKDGESVIDLGAGVGQAGHAFRALLPKLDYRGYDGAGNVQEYTGGYVKFADLTVPMAVEAADWVMCLEVGEHIPHEFEKELIRNIHALNRKGVLLSWAHLQQGGKKHVNCHSQEYLHNVFAALGYEYDDSASKALRLNVNVNVIWFQENLMVFRRR